EELAALLRSVGSGERSNGKPPASVVVLSGDVHHGYLAEMDLGNDVRSAVYQSVASPLRNPLGLPERLALGAGWTRTGERIGKTLARLSGVDEPPVHWRLIHEKPWFENHISTLELRRHEATLTVEKTNPEDEGEPRLYKILEHRLA
ncbi:MAG TPA: alkaline phosphatase family protein, partial [Rubrobacteraceae bacterium]|nr:alkaline phosphatase family protein [Rubrobacteraceae bacterium]